MTTDDTALRNLPPATCYRTHTQPDEHRGVFGAVWLADVRRTLSSPAPAASLDVERLLAYLWTATGTDGETQPNHLFAEDDPLVADVRAVIARLSAEEPQPLAGLDAS
jgi:hypothetical protein